ncbi:KPN_02809 family neutral zinc metallopeptidase [Syntrophus aciditrophicus]|nr:neutral zinc metallopeptidase [Syntrophus aciditrophicus]OPY14761.1 MAG: putative neutral zinc metallopeptidase [Syntrophus sp. PtaB.Bin075]
MRWQNQRRSENVEDRRGVTVKRGIAGAGIGTVILVLLSLYFGIDPSVVLQQVQETGPPPVSQQEQTVRQDPTSQFVSVVLADTETTWHEIFRRSGRTYEEPKLVLFSGAVQSACGFAQAAMGPFYCPGDRKVYIDLSFFEDMKNRFQAPGDFAQAYVIAHEVGHHVQNLLGITDQTQRAMQQMSKVEANQLSVRVELQADCFAGVWGCHADKVRNILESGDLEEALGAASAIGDDRIMKQTRGTIVPDAFTHGTSEQRVRWFKRGFESGDPGQCDAFNAKYL